MKAPREPSRSIVMRQLVTSGPYGPLYYDAFRSTANIEGTPILWGDVVMRVPCGMLSRAQEKCISRPFWRLSRQSFGALVDQLDALVPLEGVRSSKWHQMAALARYLCSHSSAFGSDETSPILLFRPRLVADVTWPVVAPDDDGAIRELLKQLGCRPPGGM